MKMAIIKFSKWLLRVIKKGFLFLGLLPQVMDIVITFIPAEDIPNPLKKFIANGGNWNLTLVLFFLGLIYSAYLVHIENEDEKLGLQAQLYRINHSKPIIEVGLRTKSGELSHKLILVLKTIPPRPDFDKEVSFRRQELFTKKTPSSGNTPEDILGRMNKGIIGTLAVEPNYQYQEEVEKYLEEYRTYLINRWELDIDRAYAIKPMVINIGSTTASEVMIELIMPREYIHPSVHQSVKRSDIDEHDLHFLLPTPTEPQPTKTSLGFIDFPYQLMESPITDLAPSNGPFYKEKGGIWTISYSLGKLIPHYEEIDLDQFWVWAGNIEQQTTWKIRTRIFSSEFSETQFGEIDLEFSFDDRGN